MVILNRKRKQMRTIAVYRYWWVRFALPAVAGLLILSVSCQGQVTSEDMSYTVADLAIGDAAVKAFTGDTLFVGDVAPQ